MKSINLVDYMNYLGWLQTKIYGWSFGITLDIKDEGNGKDRVGMRTEVGMRRSFLRTSDYMSIALAFCALCCQLLCYVHSHSQLFPVHLGVVICDEN